MNKPDTWYVQKGVELADGWDHDIEKDGSPVFYYENQNGYWYLDHPPVPALDALAAQLERQYWDAIESTGDYEGRTLTFPIGYPAIKRIRIIVDSKVLEGE